MLVAKNIQVYTLDRDSLTVAWDVEDTTQDATTYKVTVLRSGSEVGPFTRVSPLMNADDVREFVDTGVNRMSSWRTHYYRVQFTKGSDSWEWGHRPYREVLEGANPGGVVMEAPLDLVALEAIRRFDMTLREFIGREVVHLGRRRDGQRCGDCWDSLKRRRTRSNCKTCYDTSRSGGFFSPQRTRLAKVPSKIAEGLSSLMNVEPNDVITWASSRPRLLPRDLIIDADGRRWRVQATQRGEKLWSLTRQTVALREIPRDRVEWDINLRGWDTSPDKATPSRQLLPASDVDSYYAALKDRGLT